MNIDASLLVDANLLAACVTIFTLLSIIWGVRERMRAYQAENTKGIEERTHQKAEVGRLKEEVAQLEERVKSLEAERHEIRILTERVDSIYKELDKKIDNLISIIVGRK